MKIEQVILYYKNGLEIRRKSWDEDLCIHINLCKEEDVVIFELEDFLADDWECKMSFYEALEYCKKGKKITNKDYLFDSQYIAFDKNNILLIYDNGISKPTTIVSQMLDSKEWEIQNEY